MCEEEIKQAAIEYCNSRSNNDCSFNTLSVKDLIKFVEWADEHPNCHRNEDDVNEYVKIMEKARWQGWSLERIIRNTIMWADQNRPKGKED